MGSIKTCIWHHPSFPLFFREKDELGHGQTGKKIVGSTKYFCTAFHKDPIAALMSSNKGTGQVILQVSRSCLISQHRPSNMLPASFLFGKTGA
jgi:hypothetical protein